MLLSGVGNGFVVWAQQGIPSGIAALIVTAVPVIVLLLDWAFFSKRAPTRQALIGTTIAVAGVVTIVAHTRSLSGEANPFYVLSLLTATVGWSFGTLIQKRAVQPGTVLSFTCAQMLFGGLFQLGMSVVDREWATFDPSGVTWSSMLAVAYLVVFGSIVGLNCYLFLLTRVAGTEGRHVCAGQSRGRVVVGRAGAERAAHCRWRFRRLRSCWSVWDWCCSRTC